MGHVIICAIKERTTRLAIWYKYEFDNLGKPGDYEMESDSDDEGNVHAQPAFINHHHKKIKD